MKKIHPNRNFVEEYREKQGKYSKHGFFQRLRQVRTWAPLIHLILKVTGLGQRGFVNAQALTMTNEVIELQALPKGFDNCRILLISDIHIEGFDGLADKIIDYIKDIECDYCFLGGDYSLYEKYDIEKTKTEMKRIVSNIKTDKIFGILGNHDHYEMAQFLQSLGVCMLLNENTVLQRAGDEIYLAGVDDCYVFDAADMQQASAGVIGEQFKIMLSHSPQLYRQAQRLGYNFYITGHTHGGQVCLPGGRALIKGAKVPQSLVKGRWRYKNMTGFTSAGAGASGKVMARFFCRPEVNLLTLKCMDSDRQ